jgi:hypothetical protein
MFKSFEFNPKERRASPRELAERVAEAEEAIDECFERGMFPIVTVPLRYIESLQKGLEAHATWIPDLNVIAGTIGKEPYAPGGESEPRAIVEVRHIKRSAVHPRLTGPDQNFHGVVILDGPIPPDSLRVIVPETVH